MPPMTYKDYEMSTTVEQKQTPQAMTEELFQELHRYFSGLIPTLEKSFKGKADNKSDRIYTQFALGGLVNEINSIKKYLIIYVNQQVNAQKPADVKNFSLPAEATASGGKLPADQMIAKAFQELMTWFAGVLHCIKPYLTAAASTSSDPSFAKHRLNRLIGQFNQMKDYIVGYVNEKIAEREKKGSGFSGGEGDDHDDLADIPPKAYADIFDFLDVDVGEDNTIVEPTESDIGVTGFVGEDA